MRDVLGGTQDHSLIDEDRQRERFDWRTAESSGTEDAGFIFRVAGKARINGTLPPASIEARSDKQKSHWEDPVAL